MSFSDARIAPIDVVRGLAVLGILVMNIQAMGLPSAVAENPTILRLPTTLDLGVWAASLAIFGGKMRALFAMLFGASLLLFLDRAEPSSVRRLHRRRMFWLLLIGMLHAYLLFDGDILVTYAIAGLIVFRFRNGSAKRLFVVGAIVLVLLASVLIGFSQAGLRMQRAAIAPNASERVRAAAAVEERPSAADLQTEIERVRSGFSGALRERAITARNAQIAMWFDPVPEAAGLMLIGMALGKSGFFTARWPRRRSLLVIAGGMAALAVNVALAWSVVRSNFDPLVAVAVEGWTTMLRAPIAIAYAAMLVLVVRRLPDLGASTRLAAAGRMAFSNYLGTSLITSFVFCGYGLGLYGALSNAQLLLVVLPIWLAILLWSRPWLARFRYGPLEWLWRSLTYWRLQPMRRTRAAVALNAGSGASR